MRNVNETGFPRGSNRRPKRSEVFLSAAREEKSSDTQGTESHNNMH